MIALQNKLGKKIKREIIKEITIHQLLISIYKNKNRIQTNKYLINNLNNVEILFNLILQHTVLLIKIIMNESINNIWSILNF